MYFQRGGEISRRKYAVGIFCSFLVGVSLEVFDATASTVTLEIDLGFLARLWMSAFQSQSPPTPHLGDIFPFRYLLRAMRIKLLLIQLPWCVIFAEFAPFFSKNDDESSG